MCVRAEERAPLPTCSSLASSALSEISSLSLKLPSTSLQSVSDSVPESDGKENPTELQLLTASLLRSLTNDGRDSISDV